MAGGSNPEVGTEGYPFATATPREAGLNWEDVPPLPALPPLHTGDLPPVPPRPSRQHEPLVPLRGLPGVQDLATYHHAGWPEAAPAGWARVEAVSLLGDAAKLLPDGYGLAVFDAWRPLSLQRRIFDHFYGPGSDLEEGFVSTPSPSPATPPPHLTGGTFDLTLTWDRRPLSLGTAFDEFTARAHTEALEPEPSVERDLRRLLVAALMRVGFVAFAAEWWHFEYGTRRWAAHTGTDPLYGAAGP